MMKTIAKLLSITTATLLLHACGVSNLTYNQEVLSMQVEDSTFQIQGTQLKINWENFNNLYLTQKLLRLNDGTFVMYENARTDEQFEFEPTTAGSLRIIFDAKKMFKVYSKSHLYAYQLKLQDTQILNVIAHQDDSQQLKLVYGMSTKKFDVMLKSLDVNAQKAYYQKAIAIEAADTDFLSKWSVVKVHFAPLITPLRELGGF